MGSANACEYLSVIVHCTTCTSKYLSVMVHCKTYISKCLSVIVYYIMTYISVTYGSCLFVYFHQLSATMNNNKVEGSNRNKSMKKQKLKEKITPIDDDGAKMHCSLANSVLAP